MPDCPEDAPPDHKLHNTLTTKHTTSDLNFSPPDTCVMLFSEWTNTTIDVGEGSLAWPSLVRPSDAAQVDGPRSSFALLPALLSASEVSATLKAVRGEHVPFDTMADSVDSMATFELYWLSPPHKRQAGPSHSGTVPQKAARSARSPTQRGPQTADSRTDPPPAPIRTAASGSASRQASSARKAGAHSPHSSAPSPERTPCMSLPHVL